ncbi:MAG: type II secretion system secretin GspD [Deltaproteobacteria bacterium]|nr:type II secretion system secretin GspD [Deltaproteobacteria bacterium]
MIAWCRNAPDDRRERIFPVLRREGCWLVLLATLACLLLCLPGDCSAARVTGEDKPVPTAHTQKSPAAPPAKSSAAESAGAKTDAFPTEKKAEQAAQPTSPAKPVAAPPPPTVTAPPAPSRPAVGPSPSGVQKLPVPPTMPAPPVHTRPPAAGAEAAMPAGPPPTEPLPVLEEPPVPPTTTPSSVQQGKDTRYITIDFDNVDIQVFIKFISELTGKNFIIDDKVKGKVTILSPRKISVDEAYKVFESVLDVYGFAAVPAGDMIKVIPSQQAREKNMETRLTEEAITPEDKVVTQIVSLDYANPDEIKKVLDPLIARTSVILSYAPTGMLIITDLLSNIKKIQEIIGALDVAGVGEQISFVPLTYADADEMVKALTAVFQQQRGALAPVKFVADSRTNSIILVATETDAARVKQLIGMLDKEVPKGDTTLHVYRLQNATAEDLAKVLAALPRESKDAQKGQSPLLSKEVHVTADKATNMLIITANRDDYRIIEDVIMKLDTPRPMVYIEALIMEVNVNKDFKIGVEWRGAKDTGSISGFDTGRSAAFAGSTASGAAGGIIPGTQISTALGTASLSLPTGFSIGILGAGITIGGVVFPTIGAVLQAYQNDSDVSILSTPQILTLDNEEAEVNVGKNVPYITRQETSTTSIDYSNYEYKDVGFMLKVTPHINDENYVRLKIDQQVSKVVTAESTTGLPTTLKRTAKTVVVVKDKETVVIGGLVGDSTDMGTYKIPLLGDIPLLGWLFKSRVTAREKTNLFVFITPHIIRTYSDAAAITKQKHEEVGEVTGGVIKMREKKEEKKKGAQKGG